MTLTTDHLPRQNFQRTLAFVTECFPALDQDAAFPVRVLAAERTFWEKACLLHEETFRPADKPRKFRMARHYYDLWCGFRSRKKWRRIALLESLTVRLRSCGTLH